jgi:hypothetical protein
VISAAWLFVAGQLGMVALRAAQHKETFNYSFDVDPGDSRYFEMPTKEANARLHVEYEVQWPQRTRGVRVMVHSAGEFEKMRQNQAHQEIASLDYQKEGKLDIHLPSPGRYVVVIANRREARRRCRVEMDVTLTTGPEPETLPVSYASPQTRKIVITASLAGFALILVISGRALWRATRPPPDFY